MPVPEAGFVLLGRWMRPTRSVAAKLIALLGLALAVVFALLGMLSIRLHRQHLESATLASAERFSDLIKRSTSYSMLRNDREGLYHMMTAIGNEPGVVRIRIFNREGRISFSTDAREVNASVDKNAEACYGCHAQAEPLARLNRPDRFRVYRQAHGERVLGIINPIENAPACSNAACHAHPADQQILGVLDTNLSLARADQALAESSRQMAILTLAAVLLVVGASGLFVWRVVHNPLKALKVGTERLASGELGVQIAAGSRDELGELAVSFNTMSRELGEAREESNRWAHELAARVEQKTAELKRAHDQMLQAEKMASVGKLAAIVAHEINNPLSGILTYAKLLRKWLADGERAKHEQVLNSLELIESESRRCGEIVKNLLVFARPHPMNPEWVVPGVIVERCVRLVKHQAELANVQLALSLPGDLPAVFCDAAQVEQVLLALMMNALEAMPQGGRLTLRGRHERARAEVVLEVEDTGAGIPPELLPRLFEPFFTTRERGNGLGLAISRTIVERHNGRIEARSTPGQGTTFVVTLPVEGAGISHESAAHAATPAR